MVGIQFFQDSRQLMDQMGKVSLDIDITQIVIRNEFDRLRQELQDHYATKEDLAKLEARLVKWIIGMMLGSAGLATTLAIFIQRLIE